MITHMPDSYPCPFCLLLQGTKDSRVESKITDIFYRDKNITAFIASRWFVNNPGHVLIIPNEHIENIYSLPGEISDAIHRFEIETAKALKQVYGCDGVSSRQHNEPAGNQDVWHYHLHVFPRYRNDELYTSAHRKTTADERKVYADKLRNHFNFDEKDVGVIDV
ncbi:HIT family protein ['Paenibacillus yunnanensis' Narsing Rao et al. 2020]|uniref:HIT family protein n=1 Tax=Paenibacillus tengchongensis TaxID=2608684 RepID=UPI00124D706C|nr:HIT family protein [Paenibacillus tengchongensis]